MNADAYAAMKKTLQHIADMEIKSRKVLGFFVLGGQEANICASCLDLVAAYEASDNSSELRSARLKDASDKFVASCTK